jgi:hypothetical protein
MRRSKGRLAPFVPLDKATIKAPAWKAMSHGARSLYALLKARYNTNTQNAVYISTRNASEDLGSHSHRDNVLSWFRELDHYGFIRMVSPAHHGVNGHGKAPHWRLTEVSHAGRSPTREYLSWDGTVFPAQKSIRRYQAKNRSRGPNGWTRVARMGGPVLVPNDTPEHRKWPGWVDHIQAAQWYAWVDHN